MYETVIESDEEFCKFCEEAKNSNVLGIDLEFFGEGKYTPILCLIQLAIPKWLAVIDPFKVSISPLIPLLSSSNIIKIFHAGNQDIAILWNQAGVISSPVFDVQLAAAFAGLGRTIGYKSLVKELLGEPIDKRYQFTNWMQRPLSNEQIHYAFNDVRYLLQLVDILNKRLSESNRLDWFTEACNELVIDAVKIKSPETAYLRVGKAAGMSRYELGILRELAAWREETARVENKSLNSIMNDDVLRQLCYTPPQKKENLYKIRGLRSEIIEHYESSILKAIEQGVKCEEHNLPLQVFIPEENPSAEAIASLLGAVVRMRSIELNLSPSLISTRDELTQLALWAVLKDESSSIPNIGILQGWRAEAAGNLILQILSNEKIIRVDPLSQCGIVVE